MKHIVIGHGVECDLERLVSTRLLVQANSGAGKSWALRRLLEQTHGRIQQLVIDPEGEFASLREKFDYVLAARQGADTSADPRTAKLLAERLLELGVSAILDISELKPHERVKFVRVFLDALTEAPKELWHPVLVLLDEAHMYAPEKGDAESADAVKSLATRGRKRGFCLIVATQRLSKLHKDVAAECNNKLIGRTGLDLDMVRAGDELGFAKADRLALRDLEAGEFFAFGPALTKVVTKVKVGSVLTTHPKSGSVAAARVPPAPEKIKALLPKLSDLPAEAEAREKTVADLKRDLSTTRRELTEARKAQPVAKTERVEVPMLKDAQIQRIEQLAHRLNGSADKIFEKVAALLKPIVDAVPDVRAAAADLRAAVTSRAIPVAAATMRPVTPRAPVVPRVPVVRPDGAEALTGPEQRILDAIAWLTGIGVSEPEQPAVAFLAGYTYNAGGFNNPKGRLRANGLVDYLPGNRIRLTDAGAALATPQESPLTREELHRRVLNVLPTPEQRILQPLLAAYPDAIDNDALAEQANYTPNTGGYNNPRGRLRSLGLIEYPRPGQVRARDLLFPETL